MWAASPNGAESMWNWNCYRVLDEWNEAWRWPYSESCKRASRISSATREVSEPRYEFIGIQISRWKLATASTQPLRMRREEKRSGGSKFVLASQECRSE